MVVTLRQLSYLIALAEERHFGRAAERVHVSQPALSQQIGELEAQLGTRLFERLARDVRLTRAGETALERARAILRDTRALESEVRLAEGLAGRLALGVIPTVAPYLLPQALTRIRARDLTLDIRVREAQTAQLVAELSEGLLDAAVISLPVPAPGLAALPLFRDRFLLAGSAATLHAQDPAPDPAALPAGRLLLLDEGHCLADQTLAACGLVRRRGVDLGASSLGTLAGLVAQGFGLTFLPEIAAKTELAAAGGLVLRRFRSPEPGRDVVLVLRRGQAQARWALTLAAILIEAGRAILAGAHEALHAPPGAGESARA